MPSANLDSRRRPARRPVPVRGSRLSGEGENAKDGRSAHRNSRAEVACDHRAQGTSRRRRQEPLGAVRDRAWAWLRRSRRRRQHVPRLVRRDRLPERGPHQRRGLGGPPPPGRPVPAYRLHRPAVRGLRRAGRAAGRREPDLRPEQGRLLQLRRRGRRERGQDRSARDRPVGHHRLRRRLSRPHADGDVADLQAASLQGRHGPVRARGVPGAVPEPLPVGGRRPGRRGARGAAPHARHARGRRGRGRDHLRARPGRGRLRGTSGRVGARSARAGRRSTASS